MALRNLVESISEYIPSSPSRPLCQSEDLQAHACRCTFKNMLTMLTTRDTCALRLKMPRLKHWSNPCRAAGPTMSSGYRPYDRWAGWAGWAGRPRLDGWAGWVGWANKNELGRLGWLGRLGLCGQLGFFAL